MGIGKWFKRAWKKAWKAVFAAVEWVVGGVMDALQWLMSGLIDIPDPTDMVMPGSGTNTYGYSGIKSGRGPGFSVPIVYGNHRTGGVVIGEFSQVTNVDLGLQLWQLLALSEGEIQAPADQLNYVPSSGIYVNHNESTNFRGLSVSSSQGKETPTNATWGYGSTGAIAIGQVAGGSRGYLDGGVSISDTIFHIEGTDEDLFNTGDNIWFEPGHSSREESVAVSGVVRGTPDLFTIDPAFAKAHSDNVELWTEDKTEITETPACSEIFLNIQFVGGLYGINSSSGARTLRDCALQVYARIHSVGGTWYPLKPDDNWTGSNPTEGFSWYINEKRAGNFYLSKRFDLSEAPGNPFSLNAGETAPAMDFLIWRDRYKPSMKPSATGQDACTLVSLICCTPGTFLYPYTATMAIHAVPTDQLRGRTPQISVDVSGRKIQHYDSSGIAQGSAWDLATGADPAGEADNPAWICADILTNERYGAGKIFSEHVIDWESFYDWAQFCKTITTDGSAIYYIAQHNNPGVNYFYTTVAAADALPDDAYIVLGEGTEYAEVVRKLNHGGHGRVNLYANTVYEHWQSHTVGIYGGRLCPCNIILDGTDNIWEALMKVAKCGRGTILKSGGANIKAVWESPKEVTGMFTSATMLAGSFIRSQANPKMRPNIAEISYLNAAKDFEKDTAKVEATDALLAGIPPKTTKTFMKGVTDSNQAYREATRALWKARSKTQVLTFETGMDGHPVEIGDRVWIHHEDMVKHGGGEDMKCGIVTQSGAAALNGWPYLELHISSGEAPSASIGSTHNEARVMAMKEITLTGGAYGGATVDTIPAGTFLTLQVMTLNGTTIVAGTQVNHPEYHWPHISNDITDQFNGSPIVLSQNMSLHDEGWVVDEVSTSDDMTRKLVCSEYSSSNFQTTVQSNMPDAPETRTLSAWAQTPGDDLVADGTAAFTALERVVLNPDGSSRQTIDLNWNPPTIAPDEEWDSTNLPIPNRQLAFAVQGYEVFVQEADDGETLSGAWTFLGVSKSTSFRVNENLSPGTTYQFSVVAISDTNEMRHPEDGEIESITLSTGLGSTNLATPDAPTASIRALPYGFPEMTIGWTATNASSVVGEVPEDFVVRQGRSWLSGQAIGRTRGNNLSLPSSVPNGDNSFWVRSRTKAGIESATAAETEQPTELPKDYTSKTDQEFNADASWAGTRSNTTIDADGYLTIDDGETTGTYTSNSVDGALLGAGERRVAYLELGADIISLDTCADTTVFGSIAADRKTFEGDLGTEPITYTLSIAGSVDNATWGDFIEVGGPIEFPYRYAKARLSITRANTSQEIRIQNFKLKVIG